MQFLNKETVTNEELGLSVFRCVTDTGLKILVAPMPEYTSTFALFGTRYGSIDTLFKKKEDADFTAVPEGIAHYLEHKLFESEEVDAFARFAQTGAQANAYTSFDRTCYLFGCTSHEEENLAILLDFVSNPYFTKENVEKEQGIIGQEIRMYDDMAGWRVLFNLLCALYRNHSVRIDIAGTVESIAKIDAELLYKCYDTFYNHNNMFLCVAGNVTPEQVMKAASENLKPQTPVEIIRGDFDEPSDIVTAKSVQQLAIAMPKFAIGFKETLDDKIPSAKRQAAVNVLLNMIAGDDSYLYNRLFSKGLINDSFGYEYFSGYGYSSVIFEGDSNYPEAVYEAIKAEICAMREKGLSRQDFERSHKKVYGREIMSQYSDVSEIASLLVDSVMDGVGVFDEHEAVKTLTFEEVEEVFATTLFPERSAISIIMPK